MNENERLKAVRELIFGESMAEYQQEFSLIRDQISLSQKLSEEKLASETAILSEKLDAMEHSFNKAMKQLNTELDKNIERLDAICADIVSNRQEVGRAMAHIAETLQK